MRQGRLPCTGMQPTTASLTFLPTDELGVGAETIQSHKAAFSALNDLKRCASSFPRTGICISPQAAPLSSFGAAWGRQAEEQKGRGQAAEPSGRSQEGTGHHHGVILDHLRPCSGAVGNGCLPVSATVESVATEMLNCALRRT